MHPSDEVIFEAAYKEAVGEKLTREEVELKYHFLECETCRNRFFSYMTHIKTISGETFADYLRSHFEPDKASEQIAGQEFEPETIVYYGIKMTFDSISRQVSCAQTAIASGMIPFTVARTASCRGDEEEREYRISAGESIIIFDKESLLLTISIDQEVLPEGVYAACLSDSVGERTERLQDDGFGSFVCEFEDVREDEFSIEIRKME